MRHHEHDHDDPAVETAPHSRTEPLDPAVMKAVAAGRPDVLGTSGMLGSAACRRQPAPRPVSRRMGGPRCTT